MEIELGGTRVLLLPQKAILLTEERILVMGDLHLGKAMHFRKAGIFVPQTSAAKDYKVLQALMITHAPVEVYFLGDLFHSAHNSEWLQFESFIRSYPGIKFTLIRGNHDILPEASYRALNIAVVPCQFVRGSLIFSHEPLPAVEAGKINIAGHIHPGCVLRGLGKQRLTLPCFFFKERLFLLPAFGQLTGLHLLEKNNAAVFAVLPERVVVV